MEIGLKMDIEKQNKIHSQERLQSTKKNVGDKYAEHHNINWDRCDGKKVNEIKSKAIILEGKNDGMY
jgi:regulator of PEP synthase PpsR (kinase-PPPase family)